MADDRIFRILFQIRSDISDLQKVKGGVDEVKNSLGAVKTGFADAFRIGAGVEIVNRLSSALSQIPAQISAAISDGVRFNATLETSRLGVAAIIKQFDTGGRFRNFDDALGAAGSAIDLLRDKALKSPATFEQLVSAFQGVSGAASAANIPLRQQVDLVVLMSQALAGLGIRSDQILQESRALLTGNITEDAMAARILGITKAQIDKAKSQGELFDFLSGKLSAFAEAGARGEQSFTTQISNMSDALTQLKGIGTETLFGQIKDGLSAINQELAKPQSREMAAGIGSTLGELTKAGTETLSVLQSIGRDAIVAAPAFRGLKAAIDRSFETGSVNEFIDAQERLRGVLAEQIGTATTLKDKNEARRRLDEAIAELQVRQSEASGAMRNAIASALSVLEPMRRSFEAMVGTTAQVASNIGNIAAAIDRAGALRDVAALTELATAEALGDEQKILDLKMEQLKADTAASLIKEQVGPEEAWKSAEDLAFATRAKLQAQIDKKNLRKEEAESRKSAAAARRSEASATRAEHAEFVQMKQQESALMRAIRDEQQAIAENPFLTDDQKNAQMLALLEREREEILKTIEAWRAYQQAQGAQGDTAASDQAIAKIRELQFEYDRLGTKAQTLTFGGGFQASMIQWVNSFGTAAQQVAGVITNTLNTAINTTASAITGLIFQTGNWRKSVAQAAQAIVQDLIKVGIQMLVQATLGKFLTKANAQEQSTAGAQIAAANAPAAAATSIASFGSAAVIGGIAAAAAIALIIGLLASGGFREGGFTGSGSDSDIAGPAHRNEFYFSAPATRALGVDNLSRLHSAALGNATISVASPGFAAGGFTGGDAGSASGSSLTPGGETHIFVLNDVDELMRKWHESTASRKTFVDALRRSAG